jgi:hypothetical protein
MSSGTGGRAVGRVVPLWLAATTVGVLAGLVSGLAAESTDHAYPLEVHYPPGFEKMSGYKKDAFRSMSMVAAQRVLERKRTGAAYGILGLVLGVAMGLTGGLWSGSAQRGFLGAIVGGLAGALAGWGLSTELVPLFFRFLDPESGLVWLFAAHAGIFGGVGAAGGLALGVGLGDRAASWRAIIAGFCGGLAGAFLLETFLAVGYPLLRTFEPVPPERLPRLEAHLAVAVCSALLASIAAGSPKRSSDSEPVPAG